MFGFYDSFVIFLQELTLKEAETIALSILKQVMEEKVLSSCNVMCIFYFMPESVLRYF